MMFKENVVRAKERARHGLINFFGAALTIVIATWFTLSCSSIHPNPQDVQKKPTPHPIAALGAISGVVIDEDGEPASGVAITITDLPSDEPAVLSDSVGRFLIGAIPTGRHVIKASFPEAATTFLPVDVHQNIQTRVTLRLARANVATLNNQDGGSIEYGNAMVTFPPLAFGSADTIRVSVRALDVATADLELSPGEFVGQDANSTTTALETLGLVGIDSADDGDRSLNLAPGKEVEIMLPLPENSRFAEGDEVPMWHLDEATGLWKQEGSGIVTATSTGATIKARVKHLSWWNADMPLVTSCVEGTVRDTTGAPVAGVGIIATGVDYTGFTRGTSDGTGWYRVLAKSDGRVRIEADLGERASEYEFSTEVHVTSPAATSPDVPCTRADIPARCKKTATCDSTTASLPVLIHGNRPSGTSGDYSSYSDLFEPAAPDEAAGCRLSPGGGDGRAWYDFCLPDTLPEGIVVEFEWADNSWFGGAKTLSVLDWFSGRDIEIWNYDGTHEPTVTRVPLDPAFGIPGMCPANKGANRFITPCSKMVRLVFFADDLSTLQLSYVKLDKATSADFDPVGGENTVFGGKWPEGFLWGTAIAAYQGEGSDDAPCRKSQSFADYQDWCSYESNWTRWESMKGLPNPRGTGFATRYGTDLWSAKQIGTNAFRYSVDWAKIEPEEGLYDQAALDHYKEVVDTARSYGMTVMLTLYHWTLPIWVQDPQADLFGNTTDLLTSDPERFKNAFVAFAKKMAEEFGGRVDLYVVLNEPFSSITAGYVGAEHPPGRLPIQISDECGLGVDLSEARQVAETLVEAHQLAYDAIKSADTIDVDNDGQAAVIGISQASIWLKPKSPDSLEDQAAAERANRAVHDYYLQALVCGVNDPDLQRAGGCASYTDSATKLDFIGVNFYGNGFIDTGALVGKLGMPICAAVVPSVDENSPIEHSDMGTPLCVECFRKVLERVSSYPSPDNPLPIYITENGMAVDDPESSRRASYLLRHLAVMRKAMTDGIDIRGYFHWSIIDNYEWVEGFDQRFGLFYVDLETFSRRATPAVSAYKQIIEAEQIDRCLLLTNGTDLL